MSSSQVYQLPVLLLKISFPLTQRAHTSLLLGKTLTQAV